MRHASPIIVALGAIALLCAACAACAADPAPAEQPTTQPAAQTQPAEPVKPAKLPHIDVQLDAGYVDVAAQVVARDPDWLELLACTPNSREHEAVLTTAARPSHIHLALLMLGLEPGNPLKAEFTDDGTIKVTRPAGPRVQVTVVYEKDGKQVEHPANQWVVHRDTGEPLPSNVWLFTGSAIVEFDGQRVYMADVNGTVMSIVNFEDDLLAYDTELTNHNDGGQWKAATDLIPDNGTPVTLRLRPEPKAEEPAAQDEAKTDNP